MHKKYICALIVFGFLVLAGLSVVFPSRIEGTIRCAPGQEIANVEIETPLYGGIARIEHHKDRSGVVNFQHQAVFFLWWQAHVTCVAKTSDPHKGYTGQAETIWFRRHVDLVCKALPGTQGVGECIVQ